MYNKSKNAQMMAENIRNFRKSTRSKSKDLTDHVSIPSRLRKNTASKTSDLARKSENVTEDIQNDESQGFYNFEVDLGKGLESDEEEIHKSNTLCDNKDVSGNRNYGSPTVIKKNAKTETALLSSTMNTPCILLTKIDEPIDNFSLQKQKLTEKQSTRSSRKRRGNFSNENEFEPSSESDSNPKEENVNSDVDNEYKGNITPKKKVKSDSKKVDVPITPCRRGRSKNKISYDDCLLPTDEYFQTQGEKILTSDHTLGKLKNPHLDKGKLQELLKNHSSISESHQKGIRILNENHKSMFPMWYHILEEGYSLLLHGLGSKRNLINDFHKEIITDHPTLIINGFFPSLNIKDILDSIIVDLIETECPTNINECITFIEKTMGENLQNRLYLLIHNIDGHMLRSNKAQDILSRLAAIENVHVVASVDHINAPLIFDNVKRARYNFYWLDVTTLLPYEAETSYESSLLVHQSGTLALLSLSNVFASLTTNAKAIYMILVKYQLEYGKMNAYSGMAFKDLYQSAREDFLVVSDAALRSQLTEFLDHKLVKTKRNIDGVEYLIIPLDNSLLQKFLEDQSNK